MTCAADDNKARDTADRAGDSHGADDDSFHMDTGVSRRILTFAHYGDLISLFAVFQINEHYYGENHDNKDIPSISLSEQLRKPSGLSGLVDDSNRVGALGVLPENDTVGNHLHGHIVQHQGEQRLVCIPVCLEYSRDHSPDHSSDSAGYKHYDEEQHRRHGVSRIDHGRRGAGASDEDLPLGSDIPEAHLKSRSQTDGNT